MDDAKFTCKECGKRMDDLIREHPGLCTCSCGGSIEAAPIGYGFYGTGDPFLGEYPS